MQSKGVFSSDHHNFFGKVRQEVKVLTNIQYILDKIEHDGFLQAIRDSFEKIISHEVAFALTELGKIEKQADRDFDMKSQLTNNTYIFKENLKLITSFTSAVKSRAGVEGYSQARCPRSEHPEFLRAKSHCEDRGNRGGRGKCLIVD